VRSTVSFLNIKMLTFVQIRNGYEMKCKCKDMIDRLQIDSETRCELSVWFLSCLEDNSECDIRTHKRITELT
jgi:hypothetical protein